MHKEEINFKEAEGNLKLYFYMEDYIEANSLTQNYFAVHNADLLSGVNEPVVNILNNLGYVLKEEAAHHDVVILSFVFDGIYSEVHSDVLKWFTENLDVFFESFYHSDTQGEHEKWMLKGEENVFETSLYMRMPEYQKKLNHKAELIVNHIANLDNQENPTTVYSVEEIKKLLEIETNDYRISHTVRDGFMLDLVYAGRLTLGLNIEDKDSIVESFKNSELRNLLHEGADFFENILAFFGANKKIIIENNEMYPNILEYSGVFEAQSFKEHHIELLEWLTLHKVGIYFDACDSFEDGIIVECEPGSQILTLQRTFDVNIHKAAVDYVRVNLLLELKEHVINQANVEMLSLMFTNFKDYLEESGINVSFDYITNMFEPLTLEGKHG